jgi:hypothetical protein
VATVPLTHERDELKVEQAALVKERDQLLEEKATWVRGSSSTSRRTDSLTS